MKKMKKEKKKNKCIKIFHRNSILQFSINSVITITLGKKKNNPYFYLEIIITATKVKHTNDVIRNWQPFGKQHGLVFFLLFFFFPPVVISKKQWLIIVRDGSFLRLDRRVRIHLLERRILNWTKGA